MNKCNSMRNIEKNRIVNHKHSARPEVVRSKFCISLIPSTKTNSFKIASKNEVPLKPTTAASQTVAHKRRILNTPKNFETAISENISEERFQKQNTPKNLNIKQIKEAESNILKRANLNHRILSLKSRNNGVKAVKTTINERREILKKEIVKMHFGQLL